MMGPQYMGFGDLFIIGISGENVIGVEDGNHDQRGKTRSEAAVEENEAAVHACRGRAYDRVDHRSYEGGLAFGELGQQLLEELFAEGALTRREDGRYALADWETYRFDFNI